MKLSKQLMIMCNPNMITYMSNITTTTMSTRSVPSFTSILDPKMKLQARQPYRYSFLLQTSCLANWHVSAKAAVQHLALPKLPLHRNHLHYSNVMLDTLRHKNTKKRMDITLESQNTLHSFYLQILLVPHTFKDGLLKN